MDSLRGKKILTNTFVLLHKLSRPYNIQEYTNMALITTKYFVV